MKIVVYSNASNIIVEFQDEHKTRVHTTYQHFSLGEVKNPYYPSVYNVGITGVKYQLKNNGKTIKEYQAWKHMLCRCFTFTRFEETN